jgi:hypothetical protein
MEISSSGDQLEIRRIWMQGVADQVVDHVRPVVLRGVDVVNAEFDGPRKVVAFSQRHESVGSPAVIERFWGWAELG